MDRSTTKQIPLSRGYSMIAAPFAVLLTLCAVFARYGFFPFGQRTIAWADMNQQVVPLLCQFKDILDGRGGMLLSFKNSSGMNFWGVFFFFLASPFSLLVKFVRKEDMLVFMNVLAALKMMCCAASACFYFTRSKEHRSLGIAEITLLGFIYAFCGYTMLFYQNIIWLDMMYLFPLLLLSVERIFDKEHGSPVPYTLLMAASVSVHYYIGYMTVIFVLLFTALHAAVLIKRGREERSPACLRFLTGSVIAALMSAVVWMPSFMQYLTSGRRTSLTDNLRGGDLVTDYETVLCTVICSSALLMLAALDLRKVPDRTPSDSHRLRLVMTALMLLPILLEPINKMWHTGSYMAFPARYAYMTVFMLMILAAYTLGRPAKGGAGASQLLWTVTGAAAVTVYWLVTARYITENADTLDAYTEGLNGSESSFKGFLRLLILGLFTAAALFLAFRKSLIPKKAFVLLLCLLTVFESVNNSRIYMTSSGIRNEDTYALQREVLDLSDRIDEDGFYRVKTSAKLFDYNMIGAMDYNSIGSYTSLNDQNYLFTMKKLGYTSVWMEIGTCGGTELTDALLAVGYQIDHEERPDAVWSLGNYHINEREHRLPLGVCLESLPDGGDLPEGITREQVQREVSKTLFGRDLTEHCEPDEGEYTRADDGRYILKKGEILVYRIPIIGRRSVYFDCFDRLSTDLSEPVYDSFLVQSNGRTVSMSYPQSKENGVLRIGTFEDETINIQLTVLKDVSCRSFGAFTVDLDGLDECIAAARSCGLREKRNGLTGTAELDSPASVLLSVPYDEGFTLRVNGERTPIRRALSCFMAFDLPAGSSRIELDFKPRGFTAGAATSIFGILLFAAYRILAKRRPMPAEESLSEKQGFILRISAYLTAGLGILVFAAVYIMPLVLNIFMWRSDRGG